jgi:hypothetical protein
LNDVPGTKFDAAVDIVDVVGIFDVTNRVGGGRVRQWGQRSARDQCYKAVWREVSATTLGTTTLSITTLCIIMPKTTVYLSLT